MSTLAENFKCPICYELCRDAVECRSCHHVYCFECSSSLASVCAVCRAKTQFVESHSRRRLINDLQTNCEHCQLSVLKTDLKDHLKQCDSAPVNCGIGLIKNEEPPNDCFNGNNRSRSSVKERINFFEKNMTKQMPQKYNNRNSLQLQREQCNNVNDHGQITQRNAEEEPSARPRHFIQQPLPYMQQLRSVCNCLFYSIIVVFILQLICYML